MKIQAMAGLILIGVWIDCAGQSRVETEPNNVWNQATTLEPTELIQGRVDDDRDRDYYRFDVSSELSSSGFSIDVEASAGELIEICLTGEDGANLHCRRNASRLVLPALSPEPGQYGLLVRAEPAGATYRIDFPPAFLQAGDEREPNDRAVLAMPMDAATQSIRGRLDGDEEDTFWFEVKGSPQLWRIQANADGEIGLRLLNNGGQVTLRQNGERQLRMDRLLLLPGRHLVQVSGEEIEYDLKLIALGPPPAGGETEPNDQAGFENKLIRGRQSFGAIDASGDHDGWMFSVHAPELLAISLTPPTDSPMRFDLRWEDQSIFLSPYSAEPIVYEGLLQPGQYRAVVHARAPSLAEYNLELTTRPWFEIGPSADAVIELDLAAPDQAPAAFIDSAQQLTLPLTINHTGTQTITLQFDVRTGHHAWRVRQPDPLTLAPGQASTIGLVVNVPPDAWADYPVRIALAARNSADSSNPGRWLARTEQVISADAAAVAINPTERPAIPDALRGGINLLWSPFGAEWIPFESTARPPVERSVGWINDGMITLRDSFQLPVHDQGNYQPTWRLPVADPAQLAGVVIHPQGAHPLAMQPRQVEVLVSVDGQSFESVLHSELLAAPVEQSLVFDQPVAARFVRLNLLEPFSPSARQIQLGEFAAIAVPGSQPLADRSFDLAAPELGGHVVWSDPVVHGQSWDAVMLSETDENPAARIRATHQQGMNTWQAEWAIGFHHDRAARITRLGWRETANSRAAVGFDRVEVAVSTTSPAGPWRRIGEFELPEFQAERGREAVFDVPPGWARYIRFRAEATRPAQRATSNTVRFPDQLQAFEQRADDEYRSILGAWGYGRREAIYEQLQRPVQTTGVIQSNTRETATLLNTDETVSGFVQLDRHEYWYRLDIGEGHNRLNLDLTDTGHDEVALELFDHAGKRIELRPKPVPDQTDGPAIRRLAADVVPGNYRLRVFEPPWSLMFLWDNSGSMASYLPIVYRAVSQYARDIRSNQLTNLMPFRRGQPLLDAFTDQPLVLLQGLNDYQRNDASSAAEGTLLDATRELSDRPGLKGIVMITDAATSREAEVWRELRKVKPRIFTVQVGSTGTLGKIGGSGTLAQDLMQSWANVNRGFYAYPRNQTELSIAYARASALMRQPKRYRLQAALENIEPGELLVEGGVAGAAVELVLDASGSMLQRMQGERRIVIARDVVTELVTQTLDARTQFALRAFGHRNPDECFTDQILPLAPLDANAVTAAIASIEAKNLARTPIGDALRGVSDDLRGVEGERLVVLITDGEETCDGEPEVQIAGLLAAHPETRVHIVGFAIDDPVLTNQFRRWARAGQGEYFAANSRVELSQALSDALSPHFRILDANGNELIDGVSGQGVLSLTPGQYVIEVDSQPPRRIEGVEIKPGERTEISLDQHDLE